jgi:ribosomal protein S18 acetylase RimI-like enzyme
MKKLVFTGMGALVMLVLHAQKAPATDSSKIKAVSAMMVPPKQGPKSYKEVITDKAVTRKGLFIVHKVEDKYYFEIPDTLLGREILSVVRLSKTAAGAGYGGEIVNQETLVFEKGPSNNIFVRVITLISRADSTEMISKAVSNSYMSPIAAALPIAAYSKDSSASVIEVTDFFKLDNVVTGMHSTAKRMMNLSGQAPDRSFIESIHTYPLNTEIRTMKTFMAAPAFSPQGASGPSGPSTQMPDAEAAGAVTIQFNTSLLLLPREPMQRRLFDPRVGYFEDEYTVYGDDQQRVDKQAFAVRWRLEPRPEDMERYKRGELVEPAKPIVYYIDPATPKKWRPYLIQGINDWNKAFEKAGFKNAISAKEWPENDSTMSLEDARFSVLRYFASSNANAYGPNVHDPRSGEILESHIGWYHNVLQLVHDWYMVQCAAVDPRARKMKFDDELMGSLVRFVSSHEVGHTLGLRHNMGASSATPVEKLREKAWVEGNGHTASIMDYARFNYVAQPEDHIEEKGLFPRIGEYDRWAIQWGYTYTGIADPKEDKKRTNKWIVDSLKSNPRLWYGGEGKNGDPRAQTEDLGDDAMKAGAYGIKNLQRVLEQLPAWTMEEGDTYDNLQEMYKQVIGQFERYMVHVYRNVGGTEETIRSVEEKGNVYTPTPKAKQKEAIAFLNEQLFATPKWLLDKNILNKISKPFPSVGDPVGKMQGGMLGALLNVNVFGRLEANATRYGAANTYGIDEMITDIKKGVWGELATHKPIDLYRRDLQKAYVQALGDILHPPPSNMIMIGGRGPGPETTDINSIVRAQLQELQQGIRAAIPLTMDRLSKIHLQDVNVRITEALEPKK